jgi:hypothetical protein
MKYLYACFISIASAVGLSAQTIQFDLIGQGGSGLLSTNVVAGDTGGGSGGEFSTGIWLNQSTNILTIDVAWGSGNGFTDLTGVATNAHIHGPASQSGTAGVVIGLTSSPFSFSTGASNGSISGAIDLNTVSLPSGSVLQDLNDGNWYINIHTAANPGGEIRGNLVQVSAVPEPSTYAFLAGLGALGLVGTRRRRPVA